MELRIYVTSSVQRPLSDDTDKLDVRAVMTIVGGASTTAKLFG